MSARGRKRPSVTPTLTPTRALILVPSPTQAGLTEAERLALRLRRDANVRGECACGARFPALRVQRGRMSHPVMRHESDCPAADGPHLERLAERLGAELVFEAIVVEVRAA